MTHLTKRQNGSYIVISGGMPLTNDQTKTEAIAYCNKMRLELHPLVWDAATGQFITD